MTKAKFAQFTVALVLGLGCGPAPTEATVRLSELPLAEGPSADGLSAFRVGSVRFYSDTARIEAPDRAALGEPVDLYVSTYGGGCVAPDTTVATMQATRVTIVPYQRVGTNPALACPAILRIEHRRVRVAFGTAGTVTVRVVGREEPSGRLFAVERRIIVR